MSRRISHKPEPNLGPYPSIRPVLRDPVMVAESEVENLPEAHETPTPTPYARSKIFDFTINISHIVLILGTIGSVAWFVMDLREGIKNTGSELRQMVVELRTENKLQDAQILQLRSDNTASRAEEAAFRSEMRQSATEFQKILTDIRIQQARIDAMPNGSSKK